MYEEDHKWKPEDAVLILAVYVFFLILYNCNNLKRLLCGENNNSSFQGQQFLIGSSVPSENHYSLEIIQHGEMDLHIINSLPVCQFKESDEGELMKPINKDCAICLGEFEEGELLKFLPNCNHGFHVSCIDKWFQSNLICPICRSQVHQECSISMCALLETLRREDLHSQRDVNFHSDPLEILQNLEIRQESNSYHRPYSF